MVRTNQGGSVLGFIAVGVVLAGLLVGGVFFVRQQVAKQPQLAPDKPTSQPVQPEQPKPTAEKPKETPPAADKQAAASHKAAPAPTPVTPPATNNDSRPAELPKTGPAQAFGALLAVGLLSGMTISYIRSRRLDLSF